MIQPSRRKAVLIIIAALAALTALAVLLRSQSAQGPLETGPGQEAPRSAEGAPETTPVVEAETGVSDLPGLKSRMNGSRKTQESFQAEPVAPEDPWAISHDVAMADYKTGLWEDIRANPPEPRDPNDPEVDAELAYRLYMYYGNCSVIPRREEEVNRRLERIARSAEHARDQYLQSIEKRVDQTVSNYELCYLIPLEVDCRLEAVHWMTRAVELGHDVAEVQFYDRAMGFILRPDQLTNDPPLAMMQPELVFEFKDTARLGLARAMEKGHPEAYLANAQALLEGLIYPKDPLEAYANARAAELGAARNQLILEELEYWKRSAAKNLSEKQLAEAEKLALELQALNPY